MTLKRVLSKEDIDVIHLSTGVCTAKLLTLIDSDTTVVYAAQNVEADHAQDFVDPDLPIYKRLLGPRLIPLIEWATVRCSDGITTVSDKDKKRFADRYGLSNHKMKTIPTGTTVVSRSKLEDPSDIRDHLDINSNRVAVFHGDYAHPPNLEAARLIDKQIAPVMTEQNIDLSFILVGNDPPNVSSPNVHTTGFVENILSVLNVADVAVVPILHGGGTKTKIYDYISLSLPIVATKKAVEGIDLIDGVHACITKYSDEGIISCMLKLLRDEQRYLTMQQNLNDLSEEWTWKQSVERLDDGYHEMQNK
jgi:glycosyltransferase involved in cell wall biosynthesis